MIVIARLRRIGLAYKQPSELAERALEGGEKAMRLLFETMAGDLFFLFEDFGYNIVQSQLCTNPMIESFINLYSGTNNAMIKLSFDRDKVLILARSKHSLNETWFDLAFIWEVIDESERDADCVVSARTVEFLKSRIPDIGLAFSADRFRATEAAVQLKSEASWGD